jgi:hypothetical protein
MIKLSITHNTPVFVDRRKIAAVKRSPDGTSTVLVEGQWIEVLESPNMVLDIIAEESKKEFEDLQKLDAECKKVFATTAV